MAQIPPPQVRLRVGSDDDDSDDDDNVFEDAVDGLPELRIDDGSDLGVGQASSSGAIARSQESSLSAGSTSRTAPQALKPPSLGPSLQAPSVPLIRPPPQAQAQAEYDDTPPAFPAIGGPQRSAGDRSGASPAPSSRQGADNTDGSGSSAKLASLRQVLGVPSSSAAAGGLMPPPRTTAQTAPAGVGGASGAGALRAPLSATNGGAAGTLGVGAPPKTKSSRRKVVLEPGYGPLDWARLKSTADLRGGATSLRKITLSELAEHHTAEDAWSAFQGKVYNLTPYLRYHPGGVDELMRVAGRDGTRLFMLTHSWVNIDAMIDATMLGFLVSG